MHFFKPMNSDSNDLNYDFFSESEWRIVQRSNHLGDGVIVDPRDERTPASEYFKTLQVDARKRLRYLIPVDGWLALIIYPTISTKNTAQKEEHPIRQLLRQIKSKDDHGNRVEDGNFPVEMDLDLCRNF